MELAAVLGKLREAERHAAIGWRGAAGEMNPAEAIREVLRRERRGEDTDIELQFTMDDPQLQRVFVALCRRYGLRPFRRPRQRKSTFMLKAPARFLNDLFWPLVQACAFVVASELTTWVDELMSEFSRDADVDAP